MPIDKMYTDPMFNPFRNMLNDVDSKGITGPDVDTMRSTLSLMESLALSCNDIMELNGQLAQQQLYMKFSDAYSRALSADAQERTEREGTDDATLLANHLSAIEDTRARYESGEVGEEIKHHIPILDEILQLGRSGLSYPLFLTELEKRGLNHLLEGAVPVARAGILKDLEVSRNNWVYYSIEANERLLEQFDTMAAAAPFGVPNSLKVNLARELILWELEPKRRWRNGFWDRAEYLLTLLVDWLDSFTSFAPKDPRWAAFTRDPAVVRKNIERTQQCNPGSFRFREAIFKEYFHCDWPSLWRHEIFNWEYTANRIGHSDARLTLILDTFPHCYPGMKPPKELITRSESLHPHGAHRTETGQCPPPGTPLRSFPLPPSML